jgi:undecaprenyl-diphosphatase
MIERLINWDKDLLLWLNSLNSPYLDQPMYYISKPMCWLPVYLLLLYFCIKYYRWQTVYIVLFTAALIAISDQTCLQLFKNMFCRLRPSVDPVLGKYVHIVNDYRSGGFSFISSHAANYFTLAVFFTMLFRKYLKYFFPVALAIAVLIGYSRIYLGVHYPSDVFMGAIIGSLIGFLWGKLFLFLSGKYFSKHFAINQGSET